MSEYEPSTVLEGCPCPFCGKLNTPYELSMLKDSSIPLKYLLEYRYRCEECQTRFIQHLPLFEPDLDRLFRRGPQ